MLRTRMLGLSGWYSTNILGNRDGEVLDDPESFKTKEESKLGVLEHILSPERHPELYGDIFHKVRINYYPPRGDNKEGWDNIDIFGWLGYPMQIKVDFLCRDSILAAPLALDLVLFSDLAQRAGLGGIQEWLSFYYKSPQTPPGLYPEHDLFIQHTKLKNTLRWMMGEDQITHLGPRVSTPRCGRRSAWRRRRAEPVFASGRRDRQTVSGSSQSVTTRCDADVVRRHRQVGDELLVVADADRQAVRPQPGEEAVEVAAALAEPVAVGGEGESGHDDDVERGRVDVAGHHAQLGPVDLGSEHAIPAPGTTRSIGGVGLAGSDSNSISRRSGRGSDRDRSAPRSRGDDPRDAARGRRGRRRSRRRTSRISAAESLGRVMRLPPSSDVALRRAVSPRCLPSSGDVRRRPPCRSTPCSSARCSGTSPPASRSSPAGRTTSRPGFTIGSFTSVSLDPPLVGFLPQIASETWQAMAPDGRFCVNVLRDEQAELCWRFAKSGVGRRPVRLRDVDATRRPAARSSRASGRGSTAPSSTRSSSATTTSSSAR